MNLGFTSELYGLRFTYGNDSEIFSISIMDKVPETQNSGTISGTIFSLNPEISGTLFRNYGMLRNIVPENSGLWNNRSGIFLEKVSENVKDILNLCQPQQFLVRAKFSSFSCQSHLGILVLRLFCVKKNFQFLKIKLFLKILATLGHTIWMD